MQEKEIAQKRLYDKMLCALDQPERKNNKNETILEYQRKISDFEVEIEKIKSESKMR